MTVYRDELMELYKNPQHKGLVTNSSVDVRGSNPMCGDEIELGLHIEDGIIKEAKFNGSACFVSILSSELLLDFITNKTIAEAKKINKEKLLEMLDLNLTTSRVRCATLVLDALMSAIEKYEKGNK